MQDDDKLRGIVTDRDIAIRALAEELDVSILSLGDLAMARDSSSVFGQISAAAANH